MSPLSPLALLPRMIVLSYSQQFTAIMKFGRNLHRYQVVEWAPFYIDYQALKQLYKVANRLALDTGEDADLTGLRGTILLSSILTWS